MTARREGERHMDDLSLEQLKDWLMEYRDQRESTARYHRENYVPHRCDAAWHGAQSTLADLLVTCINENRLPNRDDFTLYPTSEQE